jgi:hypothetical protein
MAPEPLIRMPDLPVLELQAERLIVLGLHEKAGLTVNELRVAVSDAQRTGGLLVIHPDLVGASELAPLMGSAPDESGIRTQDDRPGSEYRPLVFVGCFSVAQQSRQDRRRRAFA